jgi:N-acetyltransferase
VPFDLQPHLVGDVVELRPLRESDFGDLQAAASDPLIWEQHPDARHREDVFREFFAQHLGSGGALVAIDRRNGRIVGTSRYHGYDEERSEIEIGWTFLVRSLWGGEFNAEMKRLMLDHAFRFVKTVIFAIDPKNIRSQLSVEKIGAVRVRTRTAGGREQLIYELTRDSHSGM